MSSPENQFAELQKLLGCKRYEQPPPGYFLSFSDKVMARIEAEDVPGAYSSWWMWLVHRFDAKPVLVCAYAMAVSGLLFTGFHLSQVFESELTAAPAVGGPWLAATPTSPLFFTEEFSRAGFTGGTESTTFAASKWGLREEPGQLLIPAALRPFQPAGFISHRR